MTRFGLTVMMVGGLTALAAAQNGPAPGPTGLPPAVLALACAPKPAFEPPARTLRISGGQSSTERGIHAPGDLITVNAGSENGIEVGQEYFVRRVQVDGDRGPSREAPGNIRTAGWIRIYAIDKQMSLATITYACETIDVGDYLEPLVLPTVPNANPNPPAPQRSNYARVMFGADRRRSFGQGDFFVIDHGSDHGISRGAQFVLYRDKQIPGNFLFELGEAVAVDVRPDSSTLQVIYSRDALSAGDYVALRK